MAEHNYEFQSDLVKYKKYDNTFIEWIHNSGTPTGTSPVGSIYTDTSSGDFYTRKSAGWQKVGEGGSFPYRNSLIIDTINDEVVGEKYKTFANAFSYISNLPELIVNGDFESTPGPEWGSSECTLALNSTYKHSGTYSLEITSTRSSGSGESYATQSINGLTIGATYVMKVWVREGTSPRSYTVRVTDTVGALFEKTDNVSSTWVEVKVSFIARADTVNVYLAGADLSENDTILFDDVTFNQKANSLNVWEVFFTGGIYEDIIVPAWVVPVGRTYNAILYGSVSVANILTEDYFQYSIKSCNIRGLVHLHGTTFGVDFEVLAIIDSSVFGGSIGPGGLLLSIGSLIRGGNWSSLILMQLIDTLVLGELGISQIVLSAGVQSFHCSIINVMGTTVTLNGGIFKLCSIELDSSVITLNAGNYIFKSCALAVTGSYTLTLSSSWNVSFENTSASGLDIIVNNGGSLATYGVNANGSIIVNVGGTWINEGDTVDSRNFTGILSAVDTKVQTALTTIDAHVHDTRYLQLPPTPAQGDVIYHNGTTWVRLPADITGKVLTTKGASVNPAWEYPGGLYDIIVNRADYSSDTDAGTALKAVLESASYNSVYIRKGIYDLGVQIITVSSSIKHIVGEAAVDNTITAYAQTLIQSSLNAGDVVTFQSNTPCYIENVFGYSVGSSFTSDTCFFYVIASNNTEEVFFNNCVVAYANSPSISYQTSGFRGGSIYGTHLVSCKVYDATRAFYNLNNLVNCSYLISVTCTVPVTGYYASSRLTNCTTLALGSATPAFGLQAYYACFRLTNCVNGINVSIGGNAYIFRNCSYLTNCIDSVGAVNFQTSSGDAISYYSCSNMLNCLIAYTGISATGIAAGFYQCSFMENCRTSSLSLSGSASYNAVYMDCSFVNNCYASLDSYSILNYGFRSSNVNTYAHITNCRVEFPNGSSSYHHVGFYQHSMVSNCSVSKGNYSDAYGIGFQGCNVVSNCSVTGSSSFRFNYGFVDCLYVTNPVTTNCKYYSNNSIIANNSANAIVNGAMQLVQRGTNDTLATIPTGGVLTYYIDRFAATHNTMGFGTLPQQQRSTLVYPIALGMGGTPFYSSWAIHNNSAIASIPASAYFILTHRVEGYNFRRFMGRRFIISFWVRSTLAGVYCMFIKNSGGDRCLVSEVTINSANTWEFKTVNVPAYSGGTGWNYTNGIGLDINIVLAVNATGARLNPTHPTTPTYPDVWYATTYWYTPNQVNWTASASARFYLAGIQLQDAEVPTEYIFRDYATEMVSCQRYYEKSFNDAVVPANLNSTTGNEVIPCIAAAETTLGARFVTDFKVKKRSNDYAIAYYSDSGGTGTWDVYKSAAWSTGRTITTGVKTEFSCHHYIADTLIQHSVYPVRGYWTCDNEL